MVTWNIHCGRDDGPPWERFDWPARKHALRAALDLKCLECAAWQQAEVRLCPLAQCPLYARRPYQP